MQAGMSESVFDVRRWSSCINSWHIPSEKNRINTLNRRFNKRKLDIHIENYTHITESGIYNSISDVNDKINEIVEEITGDGLYNNLTDVCDKLTSIEEDI